MSDPLLALVLGLLAAAVGSQLPRLVAVLPDPPPVPEEELSDFERQEGPPPRFSELAAEPRARGVLAALSGIPVAAVSYHLAGSWVLLGLLPLTVVGALLAWLDARTRLLPRVLVLPATGAALALAAAWALATGESERFVHALIGAAVLRSVFWVLWWVYPAGLGFGDVRLAALVGAVLAFLGPRALTAGLLACYAAFLVAGLGLVLVAAVRRDRGVLRRAWPLGPYLLGGALVGLLLA